MIERELFPKVQVVVKEIIANGECQTVTGLEFYENILSKFNFITRPFIRLKKDEIINTFNLTIEGIRDTVSTKLDAFCSNATDENVNKLISLFLEGKHQSYIDSWNEYLASTKSKGGRRKTRRCNNKKTKKVYRKTKSTKKNVKNRILKSKRMKYK